MPRLSRRRFLASSAAALSAPLLLPSTSRASALERVTVGIVGCGSRGFNLIDEFLKESDAQLVAACDVDEFHYRDREWGKGQPYGRKAAKEKIEQGYAKAMKAGTFKGVSVTDDFLEITQRDDIDIVIVATPDHWHALCSYDALVHGKDVYCEKPVTHLFTEGQAIYREVAKQKAVFQTGSQQRSYDDFRHCVELIRNGVLGKLERIEVGLPPGYNEPMGDPVVTQPPAHLDYEMWCGPSEKLPYMRARHHRWWRGHTAYGGGVLMDWIGHHNDIAQWSMDLDKSGPTKVEAVDWEMAATPIYNTPHQYTIRCEYPNGVTSIISSRNTQGTKWFGENGWLYVKRGKLEASDKRWTDLTFSAGPEKVLHSPGHVRNFL
ncbi:MAG: Gfo/Idh/MocA family oxidoreductase, partial [Planctomycetes bacterium]|nr:Gfo/Idh/MocA family oxidoreductase [Planctomycetota bacterium]